MGRPSRADDDAAVRALLEPVVASLGLDLEDLDVQMAGRRRRVSVVVDRDGGVDLDGIAEAWLTADLVAAGLFGAAGPKLLARLGEVAVLPHLGEAVYWCGGGRFQQTFLGQHGGLTPDEMEIPLVVFVS